jgi:hypothetical protein
MRLQILFNKSNKNYGFYYLKNFKLDLLYFSIAWLKLDNNMNGITSIKGNNIPKPDINLNSYILSITSSIRNSFDKKTGLILSELSKFLEKTNLGVAILTNDMISSSSDLLIENFVSHIKSKGINYCILRLTSKLSSKKQLLEYLKNNLYQRGGIVYVESFEEWNTDTLSFIFEYLSEYDHKIGFVVDISTDPRYFSLTIDTDILQKLTVELFSLPDFNDISTEILWNLTQKPNFPALTQALFKTLSQCKSEPEFLKVLKSSLLHLFLNNQQAQQAFIDQSNLEEFINAKDHWIEYLKQLHAMIQVDPVCFPISIQTLHQSVYACDEIDDCYYVKELFGKFKTLEFDKFETWELYLLNLCTKGIVTEDELQMLLKYYSEIPFVQSNSSREHRDPKIYRWKFTYILPLLRNKVLKNLKPLSHHISSLNNYEKYILEACPYLDTDILNKNITELGTIPEGHEANDMNILFHTIKDKGRVIELNCIYDEFCKNTREKENKKILQ